MEYTRATQRAATIGQGMAFLFGLAGLFSNPFLLFIAALRLDRRGAGASMAQMKSSFAGIPVRRLCDGLPGVAPADRCSEPSTWCCAGSSRTSRGSIATAPWGSSPGALIQALSTTVRRRRSSGG